MTSLGIPLYDVIGGSPLRRHQELPREFTCLGFIFFWHPTTMTMTMTMTTTITATASTDFMPSIARLSMQQLLYRLLAILSGTLLVLTFDYHSSNESSRSDIVIISCDI